MSSHKIKSSHCGNCNHPFTQNENYCPQCGQDNHNPNRSVLFIVEEFFETLFHFDTKVWKSIFTLIGFPGKMTNEFVANKRARYVPPLRFYIFVSVIYFATDKFLQDHSSKAITEDFSKGFDEGFMGDSTKELSKGTFFKLKVNETNEELPDTSFLAANGYGIDKKDLVLFRSKDPGLRDSFYRKYNIHGFWRKFKFKQNLNITEKGSDFFIGVFEKMQKHISISFFLLMPAFAFVLRVFNFRHRKNYYEHLIFSVHFHTGSFILLWIASLYDYFLKSNIPTLCCSFLLVLFFAVSQQTVYPTSKINNSAKTILIGFSYLLISLIIFILMFAYNLMIY
ncbi:MAG TPA: DUF3667 domain-containing protein [Saprospiraceae bacterium]|nr:DUF3667 domain-containing protein [Saprospiraceae bacterium]